VRRKHLYGLLETDLVKATPRESGTFNFLQELGAGTDGCAGQFVLGTTQPTFLDVYLALVVHYTPRPRCVLASSSINWRLLTVTLFPRSWPLARTGLSRTVLNSSVLCGRPCEFQYCTRFSNGMVLISSSEPCHPVNANAETNTINHI